MENQKEIAGLILSAGFSERMGKFKPLIKLDGTEFINIIIKKLSKVCTKILIVIGYKHEHLIDSVNEKFSADADKDIRNKIFFVKNENPADGMFSSLKLGVSQLQNYSWILYHFVDQPQIPEVFYYEFVKQTDDNFNWIQPVYGEKKGHPVLFDKNVVHKIMESENGTLKNISNDGQIDKKFWNCKFKETLKDFDRPEDLERL